MRASMEDADQNQQCKAICPDHGGRCHHVARHETDPANQDTVA